MVKTATAQLDASGGNSIRRGLAVILLFALFFQGFLLNTHIHGAPLLSGLVSAVAIDDAALPTTPTDNEALCPVCDQIAHAGHYVTPAASVLYAPMLSVSVIALAVSSPFGVSAPAYFWQGRAPPRH